MYPGVCPSPIDHLRQPAACPCSIWVLETAPGRGRASLSSHSWHFSVKRVKSQADLGNGLNLSFVARRTSYIHKQRMSTTPWGMPGMVRPSPVKHGAAGPELNGQVTGPQTSPDTGPPWRWTVPEMRLEKSCGVGSRGR